MTRNKAKAMIERMEKELKNEKDIKRQTFLMAAINRHSKELGKAAKYDTSKTYEKQ